MKNKVKNIFNFIAFVKTHFCKTVKTVRHIKFDMKNYFNSERITHQTSCFVSKLLNKMRLWKKEH